MRNEKHKNYIVWLVLLIPLQFAVGHVSYVMQQGTGLYTFFDMLKEHMTSAPADVMYFNKYVMLFFYLMYFICFFAYLSKEKKPDAEMKGIEQGSAHFMTKEEHKQYEKKCVTEVFDFDLKELK